MTSRDGPRITETFAAEGLFGVADELNCSPQDALDVLLNLQLVPFVSAKRRLLLRALLDHKDESHIAAGEALDISRWTVATYRRQLGTERPESTATSAS
ncbi:MAG: hypothetical protein ABI949_05385 [Ilumatobacteraceae bacterium]